MRRNHFLLLALIVLVVLIAAITFKARNSALPRDRRKIGIAARLDDRAAAILALRALFEYLDPSEHLFLLLR